VGITGVAVGVLGALMVNYLLMADLGVRLAHLSWREFWGAHVNALFSAVVTGALVGSLAALLRARGLPHLAVLVTAGVLDSAACCCWCGPLRRHSSGPTTLDAPASP